MHQPARQPAALPRSAIWSSRRRAQFGRQFARPTAPTPHAGSRSMRRQRSSRMLDRDHMAQAPERGLRRFGSLAATRSAARRASPATARRRCVGARGQRLHCREQRADEALLALRHSSSASVESSSAIVERRQQTTPPATGDVASTAPHRAPSRRRRQHQSTASPRPARTPAQRSARSRLGRERSASARRPIGGDRLPARRTPPAATAPGASSSAGNARARRNRARASSASQARAASARSAGAAYR